jgi:molybdopterin synthase catalytic subunit
MTTTVRLSAAPIDPAVEIAAVSEGDTGVGGVVSFVGLMRDRNQGDDVVSMTLEHYPGMTEKALRGIVEEARGRWPVRAVRVAHRVGEVAPPDPIVVVAVAAAHRGEAFRACEFIIDYLKTGAPFWKRERLADGSQRWVDARESDAVTARGWEPG